MGKIFPLGGALLASAPVLAAEGDPAFTAPDFSVLLQALSNWVTGFAPILIGIAGAFAAFWAVRLGIGLIKSVANKSK